MIALSLYSAALGLFFTHEVDAVGRREWRLLYVLRRMPEARARDWFVALHAPLFAGLLWGSFALPPGPSGVVRAAAAAFCVIHGGLHLRLRHHPDHLFRGWLSWGAILGAAILGALYLMAVAA